VEACLEHVDDGCRWKIDRSGIAGVSPVSSTIVLPCSVSRAPPGDRIGSGFWKVCWDRVAQIAAHTTAIDNLVAGLLLDHWFYSKADSNQSPRLSAMTSCEWSSLAAELGQERVPLSDVEVLVLVMQDVRGGASARIVSDGVACAAVQRACASTLHDLSLDDVGAGRLLAHGRVVDELRRLAEVGLTVDACWYASKALCKLQPLWFLTAHVNSTIARARTGVGATAADALWGAACRTSAAVGDGLTLADEGGPRSKVVGFVFKQTRPLDQSVERHEHGGSTAGVQHGVQSRSVPEALLTYVGLRASVDDEVDESIEEVWSRAVVERSALVLDRSEPDITDLEPEPAVYSLDGVPLGCVGCDDGAPWTVQGFDRVGEPLPFICDDHEWVPCTGEPLQHEEPHQLQRATVAVSRHQRPGGFASTVATPVCTGECDGCELLPFDRGGEEPAASSAPAVSNAAHQSPIAAVALISRSEQ
jgi:hypothetical protein